MNGNSMPSWLVREGASSSVLLALFIREHLAIASPAGLPRLRGFERLDSSRNVDEQDELEGQWRDWWLMTLEPETHPAPVPLTLVEEFGTAVALPVSGAESLASEMVEFADEALEWSSSQADRYARGTHGPAASYRAYAGAIAEHERAVGRRAHSFDLKVEVLPLAERGIWWVADKTIAVTDTLRSDAAAFDAALSPIIARVA